jgi:two-component system, cell cycle sensor histidine kinase and response regulator CckA
MRHSFPSSLLRYSIAVLSVIAAAMVTMTLWSLLQHSVFLFFLVAVILSAWRGGHGPGLTAVILGAAVSDYFFLPPLHSFGPLDSPAELSAVLFIPVALSISIFTAESVRARKGLAETSETLTSIIDASPLAIVAVDVSGNIKTWNRSAERIFGWSAHEVIGGPNPIVPEEALAEYCAIREQAVSGSGFITKEVRRLHKDGSTINISLSVAGLRDAKGMLTGTMAVIADITQQKQAVEALRQSEQQLRAIFEQAAVGIVQASCDGKPLMVNQKFCELVGYSEAELRRMTLMDITCPEDIDLSLNNLQQLFNGETRAPMIEKVYVRSNGTRVSAKVSVSAVRDGSGNPLYCIGIVEDTTERKHAEQALRESEQRFRAIFEYAAVGIAQISLDGKWLMVNQRLCDILGYSQTELRDLTIDEITFADDLEPTLTGRRSMLSGECEPYVLEKRYVRKDRALVWARVSVSLVRDASGNPEYFLSVIEDISERKHAEQALLRLATAVEQAAESIVITDAEGKIQYVNPAFERTTGYERDEVIGQTPRMLKSEKQDDAFYFDLWNTIKQGEVWTGHFINRKKDGTLYEEEATISPVRDAAGNLVNFVAVKRDVTKEVGLESQLVQAQKMEAIGTLAGGVAHDFNNLLTVIIGYSQFGLARLSKNDPLCGELKEIQEAGTRAAALTSQLLAFSRKQVFQPRVLDLNGLVTDLKKMLLRLIGEDVDLTAVLDFELGLVKADPGQLQQVIMNLVVNARDAMPNGGKLTIETCNVDLNSDYGSRHIEVIPGSYVMVAISDTGCGMDQETQSHIFEPFFTTKELGRGTGLGLSTVYGIVKQSGGFVWVYSEPGQGTTFKVYLPRIADTLTDDCAENQRSIVRGGSETLLLVEDETSVRDLAARALKEYGYTVLEASNGELALRMLEDGPGDEIQLLVTDVVMPVMGGCDLAEQLAVSRPELRVLYLSGYTDKAIVHQGVLDSDTPFLQKPFTTEALAKKVRDVLDGARQCNLAAQASSLLSV